ncbi:uncharacterized protein ACIQIH_003598 isoform 1-T1 [Cyanocitta cristata]
MYLSPLLAGSRARSCGAGDKAKDGLTHRFALFSYLEIPRALSEIITEWFGFEGTLRIIEFQPPYHGQGHLPLHQIAQSPIQPDLQHFQEWSIPNFSEQCAPFIY